MYHLYIRGICMHCPVCKEAMIIVEHERIELDYCTKCRGVWFDAGELELMLEAANLDVSSFNMDHIMSLPEKKLKEATRRCPLCRKKMRKVAVGHEPEVIIDVCPTGEGLWFDGGEVGHIIKQLLDKPSAESGEPEPVVTFLGEVFRTGE
jgi:Zn-finger nucleic acid-binding protein